MLYKIIHPILFSQTLKYPQFLYIFAVIILIKTAPYKNSYGNNIRQKLDIKKYKAKIPHLL